MAKIKRIDYGMWESAWRTKATPWIYSTSDRALHKNIGYLRLHGLKPGTPALVPLCGNSESLRYLRGKGLDVCGIEFVPTAVRALKRDKFPNIRFKRERVPFGLSFTAPRVKILQMDFFKFKLINTFEFVYDRAAIIAIAPKTRRRYASIIQKALQPGGLMLVNTYTHRGGRAAEPPFPITVSQLRKLFPKLKLLKSNSIRTKKVEERFKERGMTEMTFTTSIFRKPKGQAIRKR